MRIAVVGAGPAGLTAAYRLQQAGHSVEVLEALDVVGGRTHAEHFGPGHHCDTGAGWLTPFYTQTLALFTELGFRDVLIRPRKVRGAPDLRIDGELHRAPSADEGGAADALLTPDDRRCIADYFDRLIAEQPDGLLADLAYDDRDAETELAQMGHRPVEYIYRPLFEGPFFSRLSTMSATKVRAWLRALHNSTFYQVAGGMDAPWLKVADTLNIRTGVAVDQVRVIGNGVEITTATGSNHYDGAILATPAPAAARMLRAQPEAAPSWLAQVKYSPEVRVYAARPDPTDSAVGMRLIPPDPAFSIEWYSGKRGAWGACPPDWQWALICAYGPASAKLLQLPAAEARHQLWEGARQIVPELFTLEEATVIHDIRWEWAIPQMETGHYTRLANYQRQPPLVLAGDWTEQACVEGAVRSGQVAAAAFGHV